MIIVKIRMPMKPKNRIELLNAIRNISLETRKEVGCLDNILFQNLEDENELIMIEAWKSKSLLKKHWKTLNFSALLGTKNLLSRPMDVEVNKVAETLGLEEIEKSRNEKNLKIPGKGLKINKNLNDTSI
jgi:quinol monooxygenase YgiN